LVERLDVHPWLLEQQGVPPLITLCSSPNSPCCIKASRAVANLSVNSELINGLIGWNPLQTLLKSIDQDGDNCRFATIAIANFATNFLVQNSASWSHPPPFIIGFWTKQ
jgi:hypothetical protein